MVQSLIALGVLGVILISAALYVVKAKKVGKKCIGCPSSGTCGGCCGCSDK